MIFHLKWNWMMLITQKWGKPIKVLKCEHRFCLNCLAAWIFSWKNEEESQCPACKVNTLKADISPSFDLQTLLSLFNPLSASIALILETSQLICSANQLTGFYMAATLALNGLKYRSSHPEMFLEKSVLKISSKFTGEHSCPSEISVKLLCKLKSHFGKSVPL